MNRIPIRTLALPLALMVGAFATAPTAADAQISLEVRGSLQYPTGDFGDQANSQAGFGGDVFYSLNPAVSLYGGYAWDQFGCEGCDEDNISTKGFELGAKFLMNRQGGILPWARAGAVFPRLVYDIGTAEAESDRGVGFQASVGVDIPLGEVMSFSPALRYQRFNVDFAQGAGLQAEQEVSFLALDFGLHFHLSHLGN